MQTPPPAAAPRRSPRPAPAVDLRRILHGVGWSCLAHLVTVAPLLTLYAGEPRGAMAGFVFGAPLVGQLLVLLGCVVAGALLIERREMSLGIGVLSGWLVGVLLALAVATGALVNAYG